MSLKKTHKRKKKIRMRGTSTHGGGARKKRKKSGHKGGVGMAGSGKRADHKKTLVTKLYGHSYFGKQGITSKKTKKDKRKRININDIELDIERYVKRGLAKKTKYGWEVNLKNYKILGEGEVKSKLFIKAEDASASAVEKIKRAGGQIVLATSSSKSQTKASGEISVLKKEKSNFPEK